MNILNEIAERTRERIAEEKRRLPLAELKAQIHAQETELQERRGQDRADQKGLSGYRSFPFRKALAVPGMSYICEVKKASPSKGLIAPDFPYLEIAREYEAAGAAAVSCLTEPYYFQGEDRYLREIAQKVQIPVLRKDFTVDEYMVYQAKAQGAAAVLLICALLDDAELKAYRELAEELGLDALTEAHDEREAERALKAGTRIMGVNNRDLRTFEVDMGNSLRLRGLAPKEVLFVSESGIQRQEDVRILLENGVNAVLIGETLMRSSDRKRALEELNGGPLTGRDV